MHTYYYGTADPGGAAEPGGAGGAAAGSSGRVALNGSSDIYDERWYYRQRSEGARLVAQYLRLQPSVTERFEQLSMELLGRGGGSGGWVRPAGSGPVLGVHLRGTDKGKYLQTAGSGRQVRRDIAGQKASRVAPAAD